MCSSANRNEDQVDETNSPIVARHKSAIRRNELSLPIKCLIRDDIIQQCSSFFDYGCGHGEDIQHVHNMGIESDGWDPVHRPDAQKRKADAVNLGYVANVIENLPERSDTIHDAWGLSRKVFSIAVRIRVPGRGNTEFEYGDGVLTRIGTFQKYFTQAEFREYIETLLATDVMPAAPGVFYAFKDEELRQRYVSARYRRRAATPRKRVSEIRFESNRRLLEPLMRWISDRGRLPEQDEFDAAIAINAEFGSLKRAFALIRRVTSQDEWQSIREKRVEDLLVFLALSKFRRRPKLSRLPIGIQRDIRALFGSYKRGCERADKVLFDVGDPDAIDEACKKSSVGKLLPNALYVHSSAMCNLEPLLRIYEGCARAYLGEIEGANIIKLHRFSGKISYLVYPDFEIDPHPALVRCVKLSLRSLDLNCYDYSSSSNPPVLHRKETFLSSEHASREKFTKLTKQEERHGLLDHPSTIGTRDGWRRRLEEAGFFLRGHRLLRARR